MQIVHTQVYFVYSDDSSDDSRLCILFEYIIITFNISNYVISSYSYNQSVYILCKKFKGIFL